MIVWWYCTNGFGGCFFPNIVVQNGLNNSYPSKYNLMSPGAAVLNSPAVWVLSDDPLRNQSLCKGGLALVCTTSLMLVLKRCFVWAYQRMQILLYTVMF